MVSNQAETAKKLNMLLQQMQSSIEKMEKIIPLEQEHISHFRTEALQKLAETRKDIWQELHDNKSRCQKLMQECNVNRVNSLRSFIDLHLGKEAPALQRQRQELSNRVDAISACNKQHGIQLRAAYESISTTLGDLGLLSIKSTYGPDGSV
ncbi:MAG: flagellar export chaperone FlgN [Mariprofundaceae bacterium]